jgi:hypothetical protein
MSRELTQKKWSGRLDSNQRPPAPKADTLPDCATPRIDENDLQVLSNLINSDKR